MYLMSKIIQSACLSLVRIQNTEYNTWEGSVAIVQANSDKKMRHKEENSELYYKRKQTPDLENGMLMSG